MKKKNTAETHYKTPTFSKFEFFSLFCDRDVIYNKN